MPKVRRVDTPRGRVLGDKNTGVDQSSNRLRSKAKHKNVAQRGVAKLFEFVNPYPWMSEPEAMVQLELERREVPFSWRYFDGEAPNLKLLMPNYAPEFTLREYKAVIVVVGSFFGTLPGVIDSNALATVLLEEDGWTVAVLTEGDIRGGVSGALDKALPQIAGAPIRGASRPNPYGIPDFMAKRRAQLSGQGLLRARFKTDPEKQKNQGGSEVDAGRKRSTRRRSGAAPRRVRFRRST